MNSRTNEKELRDEEKETGRLEAFSDGVFAVAITLLILDIRIPEIDPNHLPSESHLLDLMVGQLPNFSSFVISFFTIGIMWLNHHKIFKHIKRVDTGLILLNLLLLLIIVFVPVPTAFLAGYLFNTTDHVAAIFYSSTFFLMAVSFNILWRYAAHDGRLLGKNPDMQEVKKIDQQYMFGPVFYIFAVILSIFNTPATAMLEFAFALFFTISGKNSAPEEAESTQTILEKSEAE